ncbi:MAG: hypothetical protein ACK5AZ_08410 [Bryobacteraceae bacterium]
MHLRSARKRAVCLLAVGMTVLPAAQAQSGGLTPAWELRESLDALTRQVERVRPILSQLTPKDWVAKGAPHAYIRQLESSNAELDYLIRGIGKLAGEPEKLTTALETLFRMDSLQAMLLSLSDGVRNYQNPALADLMRGIMAESSAGREKLRQYVVELAESREREFEIMDREAQRCRGVLSRQPAPPASRVPPAEGKPNSQ